MKKCLFSVALAGIVLAGCVKNEVAGPEKRDVIVGFDSPVLYSNLNTKAQVYGEIGTYSYTGTTGLYTYPREENFRIFAVQHVGNLTSWDAATECEFNDQAISYDGSLDAWAPLKTGGEYYYWPDGKLLSFAAMSPADLELSGVTPEYTAAGLEIADFVVNDDPAKQYDLLYSERAVNKSASDMIEGAEYYSGVPILFKHALSSIHFSLKKEHTVTEDVILTGIKLKNAKNKGTFNENITDETAYASSPEWTLSSGVAEYVSFKGKVDFPLTAQYVSALAAADTDEPGEDEVSHPLLLIPQVLTDDVMIEISYKVGGEAKTKTIQLNEYPKASGVEPISKWNTGTRYTYRLFYGKASEMQDIIFFSPSTDGWTEASIIEVLL